MKKRNFKKVLLPILFLAKNFNYIIEKNSFVLKIPYKSTLSLKLSILIPKFYLIATNIVAHNETINNKGIK